MSNDRVDRDGRADDRELGDHEDYRNPQDTTASRLFDTDAEISKAAGIRINLWLGAAMLLLGALFLLWVRLRPLRIQHGPSAAEQAGMSDGPSEA